MGIGHTHPSDWSMVVSCGPGSIHRLEPSHPYLDSEGIPGVLSVQVVDRPVRLTRCRGKPVRAHKDRPQRETESERKTPACHRSVVESDSKPNDQSPANAKRQAERKGPDRIPCRPWPSEPTNVLFQTVRLAMTLPLRWENMPEPRYRGSGEPGAQDSQS